MEASKRCLSSKDIRKDFIEYFVQRDHTHVPSSSTLPHDDPTLLFTNAGMNQFKNIFLGLANPEGSLGRLKRACNSQKCIRAGGKHNDLEDVGKDVYHHTFFEMLGNWSFNDYFKKDAIKYAWDLLTKVWNLPADRFYVTYFQGTDNVPRDEECKRLWMECGLPESRILPFGLKENFWEMGDTGPCGPCSEIHFDRIGGRDASELVNKDDPNVLEIWNLVFIQYNREADGSLVRLPTYHVDTGMGFERIVSIIQNKDSNYDTDVFEPYFIKIKDITGLKPYSNLVGPHDPDGVNMAYRVVADHIRTLTISISDGCRPDNVGRGYVVRRILRRAIRYSQEKLNMPQGSLSSLVDIVRDQLGEIFPEIEVNHKLVKSIIDQEERQFLSTLSKGRIQLEKSFKTASNSVISGKVGWVLYETYGFPIDLTQIMAQEQGFSVDIEEFEKEKQKAQTLSQQSSAFKGNNALIGVKDIEKLKEMKVAVTDSSKKYVYTFSRNYQSYIFDDVESLVSAIKTENGFVENISDSTCCLFLESTNFYAEEGGQQADKGIILMKNNQFVVDDVQVFAGYVAHIGSIKGTVSVGDKVTCKVEVQRRTSLMINHTSTHLLNFSLRETIGHTDQRGSLVTPEKVRFDFQFDRPLTDEEIDKTDLRANKIINDCLFIDTKEMEFSEAKKISGIRAVFGETYPDVVRVVSIGIPSEDIFKIDNPGYSYSIELCGGLHVENTSHIKSFVTISEEGIGKGIRRVVCLTNSEAKRANDAEVKWKFFVRHLEIKQSEMTENFDRQKSSEIISIIASHIEELGRDEFSIVAKNEFKKRLNSIKSDLSKRCDKFDESLVKNISDQLVKFSVDSNQRIAMVKVLSEMLGSRCLEMLSKNKNYPLFLLCKDEKNKIYFLCSVPKNYIENMSAKDWTQFVCDKTGSKSYGNNFICRGSIDGDNCLHDIGKIAKEFIENNYRDKLIVYS